MSQKVKVRKIGGSFGILLPKETTEAMALHEGDELLVSVSRDSIQLTPYNPDFDSALNDARAFMRSHRDAFKELAK